MDGTGEAMKHLYAAIRTSTNGMENYVPYAILTISPKALREQIVAVQAVIETTGAASLSFWDGDAVQIDWLKELPKGWLDETGEDLLDRTLITYTSKPPEDLDCERVDASMVVFWDTSMCVRCDDRYAENGAWYESPLIFYADLLDLLDTFERRK